MGWPLSRGHAEEIVRRKVLTLGLSEREWICLWSQSMSSQVYDSKKRHKSNSIEMSSTIGRLTQRAEAISLRDGADLFTTYPRTWLQGVNDSLKSAQ